MNGELMTQMFFGMAFILLIAISIYAVVILPEVTEYNEHLKDIKYQLEQGNCSAGYVTIYPDYYPDASKISHEEAHNTGGD